MYCLSLTLKFGVKKELVATPGFYIEAFLKTVVGTYCTVNFKELI